jgi:hypothetical protein
MNRSNLRLLDKVANRGIATKKRNVRNRVVAASRVEANRAAVSKAADDKPCIVNLTSGGRRLPPFFYLSPPQFGVLHLVQLAARNDKDNIEFSAIEERHAVARKYPKAQPNHIDDKETCFQGSPTE